MVACVESIEHGSGSRTRNEPLVLIIVLSSSTRLGHRAQVISEGTSVWRLGTSSLWKAAIPADRSGEWIVYSSVASEGIVP